MQPIKRLHFFAVTQNVYLFAIGLSCFLKVLFDLGLAKIRNSVYNEKVYKNKHDDENYGDTPFFREPAGGASRCQDFPFHFPVPGDESEAGSLYPA